MIDIKVDDDFARFGGKSYAINKINSIEVRERQPHGRGGAMVCGVIALLTLMVAITPTNPSKAGSFVITAIFSGLAFWQWRRSKIREYQLFLMTSSSETQAFITRDADEVLNLRDEIEQSMLRHSRAPFKA